MWPDLTCPLLIGQTGLDPRMLLSSLLNLLSFPIFPYDACSYCAVSICFYLMSHSSSPFAVKSSFKLLSSWSSSPLSCSLHLMGSLSMVEGKFYSSPLSIFSQGSLFFLCCLHLLPSFTSHSSNPFDVIYPSSWPSSPPLSCTPHLQLISSVPTLTFLIGTNTTC